MEAQKEKQQEAARVIEAFGGTVAVSTLCGIKAASVSGWKKHGLPPAREQFLRLLNPAAFKKTDS